MYCRPSRKITLWSVVHINNMITIEEVVESHIKIRKIYYTGMKI